MFNLRISKHLNNRLAPNFVYVFYRKGDILGESVTLSKDTLYGGVIVLLAILLIGSVFTQGYGIVPCKAPAAPAANTSVPAQPSGTANGTVQPSQPTAPTQPTETAIPSLTVDTGTNPGRGNSSAVVTFVEFSDFQCPFCGRLYGQAGAQIKTNYVDTGKVEYFFRDFPLSFHPHALATSVAARCAADQGMFWEMHDKLYDTQSAWSGLGSVDSAIKGYAVDIGLDNATFVSCYDNQSHVSEINDDFVAGQSYGVQGTPSNFIIIPKNKVDETTLKNAVSGLNQQYGEGISLFMDSTDYTVMVPGAYPYEAFDAILKVVNY
jgi:protein-disulfide isomerase